MLKILALKHSTITPNPLYQTFIYGGGGDQHNTNLWMIQMPHFNYWVVSFPTLLSPRYTYKQWNELVSLHSILLLLESYQKVGSG